MPRDYLMRSKLLPLLLCLLALGACTTVPYKDASIAQTERASVELSDGWAFRYQNDWSPEQAEESDSDGWAAVSLPHSWNRLGEYRIGRTEATDNRQGKGWYKRTIDGTSLDPSQRHFIEFDAVGNVADLWLNGKHLGRHAGAFTRFRIELTSALNFTGQNQLLVRADNSDPQPGSSTADVIPLLGDFFIHGGIYRKARLISVAHSHISLSDFGGPGIYATSKIETDGSASVETLVRITDAKEGQNIALSIVDKNGREVAHTDHILSDRQKEAVLKTSVSRPRLWNGRAAPYLYSMFVRLIENDKVIDSVKQPLGIRAIAFDANNGFSLNGKYMQLRGVSRHQDYLGKGWAISDADRKRDMELITEMGANSIRVAHYPQAPEWFDLADSHGMIVWAEVPFVNKLSFGDIGPTPELIANARQQMKEMIRQNFNHPSIVTWGIGNEVDIDLAFGRLGPKADSRGLLKELNGVSKQEDPSRPTVIADCCEDTPGDKADYLRPLTGESDLMGYNRYYGWYYGEVGDLGPHLDKLHAQYPNIPISVSEYGAGGSLTQHNDHPEGRPTNITGRPQPEEFQSWWHEQSWPQIRERDYLWGSWIWNMFDFSSRIRQEGDATDINTKGLVSYDRKTRKDAFFYYKAQWSDDPVLHITSKRFQNRTDATTRIKLYSNADKIALSLNGKFVGNVSCRDRICIMENVRLAPGVNRIAATAKIAGVDVRDEAEWTLIEQR